MKPLSTNDNYIPQLITLGCIMIFSLAVRSIALNCKADGFTAFGLFILSTLISTALLLAIQSILQDLFLLLIKFPKEERTVEKLNTSPKTQLSNYEQYRQDALLAKAEEEQNKINTVLSYTEKTLAPYVIESELSNLCTQISYFLSSDWKEEESREIKISSQLKSIDLMHFGWNIAQPFGKSRKEIATFLKYTFTHALADVEVSTLQRKLTNTEGKFLIPLQENLSIESYSSS